MDFKIAYDDVKKLLILLETNSYKLVAPYIQILHNLPSTIENDEKKLVHYVQEEKALIEQKLTESK